MLTSAVMQSHEGAVVALKALLGKPEFVDVYTPFSRGERAFGELQLRRCLNGAIKDFAESTSGPKAALRYALVALAVEHGLLNQTPFERPAGPRLEGAGFMGIDFCLHIADTVSEEDFAPVKLTPIDVQTVHRLMPLHVIESALRIPVFSLLPVVSYPLPSCKTETLALLADQWAVDVIQGDAIKSVERLYRPELIGLLCMMCLSYEVDFYYASALYVLEKTDPDTFLIINLFVQSWVCAFHFCHR